MLGLLASFPVSAENTDVKATFLGRGVVLAPADSVTVRFEIMSCSNVLSKAQKENQRLVQNISKILADYGTPVREGYYMSEGFSGARFLVTSCLSLTTNRVQETEAICQLLLEQGVSALFDVSYACHDLTAYKEEALRLAIADAQSKANSLGISLPLSEIRDLGCYDCGFSVSAPNTAPTVTVECSVQLYYE